MNKHFIVKLWRFFGSVKLAVTLFLIISTVSVVGTLLPQEERATELIEKYGQVFFDRATRLGLTDLYHSKYFIGLALLFTLNLLVCTIQKLQHYKSWLPRKHLQPDFDYWSQVPFKKEIPSQLTLEEIARRFNRRLYTTQIYKNRLMAQRGRWSRFGFLIVHVGLFFIIIGMIIGGLFGDVGGCFVTRGEITDSYYSFSQKRDIQPDFQVRLDDFQIDYYPPKVLIGATFQGRKNLYMGTLHETFNPEGTNYFVKVVNLKPDVFWQDGRPLTRSVILGKPAVHLEIYQGGELVASPWIGIEGTQPEKEKEDFFQQNLRFVDLKLNPQKERALISIIQNGQVVRQQEIAINWPLNYQGRNFYLTDYNTDETGNVYVKLQLSKDPGILFFWTGSCLMLIGVMVAFYYPHRRYYVKKIGTKILVGATISRGKINLQADFSRWLNRLKE